MRFKVVTTRISLDYRILDTKTNYLLMGSYWTYNAAEMMAAKLNGEEKAREAAKLLEQLKRGQAK